MPDPAWTDALLQDPHAVADKRSRVQRMFAAIAPAYDRNNRLHSLGQDQRWRRRAVELSTLGADDYVVDAACGTGDLTLLYADELHAKRHREQDIGADAGQVVGVDYTFEMVRRATAKPQPLTMRDSDGFLRVGEEEARARPVVIGPTGHPLDLSGRHSPVAKWLNADATALPLADASADVVSIAFGIRNVQEPAKAIAEFYRVLRPGGRVIVLEFSQPESRVIRFFNDLYCKRIMPHTATWLSGDTSGAYKYLPMSVATFMNREQMKQALRDAGFVDVTEHPMTFGVAVVYRGYKR